MSWRCAHCLKTNEDDSLTKCANCQVAKTVKPETTIGTPAGIVERRKGERRRAPQYTPRLLNRRKRERRTH